MNIMMNKNFITISLYLIFLIYVAIKNLITDNFVTNIIYLSQHVDKAIVTLKMAYAKYGGRSPKVYWAPCHVMCTAVLIG
jgi:hypothetical protein